MDAIPDPGPAPDPVRAVIPNALTVARLVLTAAFIAALSVYRDGADLDWILPLSAGLFVIAAVTDALDGALARRWNAISTFGRVMDPLADKVLVIGAFILMAGPGFQSATDGQLTRVAPWMVVVILTREMLATSIRGVVEAEGQPLPAVWSGKLKMILQAICVPVVLLLLWRFGAAGGSWSRTVISGLVWATVVVTIISGWRYLLTTIRYALPGPSRENA
ncbi:MAG: CDP-diacylglycerol--glycerol-3-phosphate 3-phosphatidyltransferase [Phycisphaeraceae bacterium]|nr:CDP-diacylglycerol--glycerol-3-phosphate 3-phosphatidyltransferase [Phycisphaeraceae bacterium]